MSNAKKNARRVPGGRRAALASWQEYPKAGSHMTEDEAVAWLAVGEGIMDYPRPYVTSEFSLGH